MLVPCSAGMDRKHPKGGEWYKETRNKTDRRVWDDKSEEVELERAVL